MAETGRQQQVEIVCLQCRSSRLVSGTSWDEVGHCPRCGYQGWAMREEIERQQSE